LQDDLLDNPKRRLLLVEALHHRLGEVEQRRTPDVDAERVIRLDVDEKGIVDLMPWRDAKSSLHPMAYESALHLCSDNDGRACLPLVVVYQRLASFRGFDF
jgi:hypothetical protein